jgi:hypothetical protein
MQDPPMSKRARIILIAASVACWIAACCLPALNLVGKANTLGESTTMSGVAAFFSAFFAMFDRQYAWMANPLAILAACLVAARKVWPARVAAVLAILVAQHTWKLVGTEIIGDEGGVKKYLVTSLGPGFYLWVLSFVLIAIATIGGELTPATTDQRRQIISR